MPKHLGELGNALRAQGNALHDLHMEAITLTGDLRSAISYGERGDLDTARLIIEQVIAKIESVTR